MPLRQINIEHSAIELFSQVNKDKMVLVISKKSRIIVCGIMLLLLAGCFSPKYTIGSKTFNNANSALAYARESIYQPQLEKVSKSLFTINGNAVFIAPSMPLISTRAIKIQGYAPQEHVEYLIELVKLDHVYLYRAIQKASLFREIDYMVSDNPGYAHFSNYDFILYVDIVSHDQVKIMLRGKEPSYPIQVFDSKTHDTPESGSYRGYGERVASNTQSNLSELCNRLELILAEYNNK